MWKRIVRKLCYEELVADVGGDEGGGVEMLPHLLREV